MLKLPRLRNTALVFSRTIFSESKSIPIHVQIAWNLEKNTGDDKWQFAMRRKTPEFY